MTKDECLAHGGHCWVDSGTSFQNTVAGAPVLRREYCKHCPAQRKATSQPQWAYEETPDRMLSPGPRNRASEETG